MPLAAPRLAQGQVIGPEQGRLQDDAAPVKGEVEVAGKGGLQGHTVPADRRCQPRQGGVQALPGEDAGAPGHLGVKSGLDTRPGPGTDEG